MANQQQSFSFMQPPPEETPVVEPAIELAADPAVSRETVLKALRNKVGCVTTIRQGGHRAFSTGCPAIDSWLPMGGLHPSTLTEWIAAHESAAAGTLAMSAAANRLRQSPAKPLVVVDCEGVFYPPAAVPLGVPHERMILLRPRCAADAIWAIDQSLRSGAVAAVWASLPMQIDDRDARRLQLAAETGQTPGLLVRDFSARRKPSFADVQFYVSGQRAPGQRASGQRASGQCLSGQRSGLNQRESQRRDFETLSITLDRVRGGVVGRQLDVQMDDRAVIRPVSHFILPSQNKTQPHETAAEHLASQLANPANAGRVEERSATRRRPRTAS